MLLNPLGFVALAALTAVSTAFAPASLARRPLARRRVATRPAAVAESLQLLAEAADALAASPAAIAAAADPTAPYVFTPEYSQASYYTSLGLYLLSVPGLYSLVKRSVKVKVKEETFAMPGPAVEGAKSPRQMAAEVMAYFQANNYEVADASETIRFRGVVERSKSQAFFLVFCSAIGLATLALVLSITTPDFFGVNWYLMTLIAPYAGVYYWSNADSEAIAEVKLTQSDDDRVLRMKVRTSEDELVRMTEMLELTPEGKVRVKGIFEAS